MLVIRGGGKINGHQGSRRIWWSYGSEVVVVTRLRAKMGVILEEAKIIVIRENYHQEGSSGEGRN